MSERIGAIRDNGVVVNVILWADHTPDQLKDDGVFDFEEVTDLDPQPGIGWLWDATHGYRPPKPYPSWLWDGVNWASPVEMPSEGGPYTWNEETQSWDQVELPA